MLQHSSHNDYTAVVLTAQTKTLVSVTLRHGAFIQFSRSSPAAPAGSMLASVC